MFLEKKSDIFREMTIQLSGEYTKVKEYIKTIKDREVDLDRTLYDPFQSYIKDTHFLRFYKAFLESPSYIEKVNVQFELLESPESKTPPRFMSTIQEGYRLEMNRQMHHMSVTEDLLAPPPSNPPKPLVLKLKL